MGAIEQLKKYAADEAAPDSSIDLTRIPIAGENVPGYGIADSLYLDKWWKAYDNEHALDINRLNRADVDKLVSDTSTKWKSEVDSHRNKWYWSKEGPASWQEATLGYVVPQSRLLFNWIRNGTVSADWLAEQAAIGKDDNSLYDDPNMRDALKDVVWRTRNKELFGADRSRDSRQVERRATGAAHVTGQVLDAATLGLGANKYTKAVTGEGIDDLARSYGKLYAQDYGEDAARRMEHWLRLSGLAGHAAVDAIWLAGGSALSNVQSFVADKEIANAVLRTAANAGMAYTTTSANTKLYATGLKALSETAGYHAGNMEPGSLSQGALGVASMITGGAGEMVDNAGAFSALGVVGKGVLGGYVPAASGQGMKYVPGMIEKVPMVGPAVRGMHAWSMSPSGGITAPIKWVGKKYVSGMLDNGILWGTVDNVNRLSSGEGISLNPMSYAGYGFRLKTAPIIYGGDWLIGKYSSTYRSLKNHGTYDAAMQQSFKDIAGDPERMAAFRADTADIAEALGLPQTLSDQEYMSKVGPVKQQQLAAGTLTTDWLNRLDDEFDWNNCTQQQFEEKLDQYTREQRADAKMATFGKYLSHGGATDFSIFGDDDLSPQQREELLKQYIGSEWMEARGTLGLLTDWHDEARLKAAMHGNDNVHHAVAEYGKRLCYDIVTGAQGYSQPTEVMKTALSELTENEKKYMLSDALYTSTPEQLANFTTSGNGVASPELAGTIEEMVKDRMANDRNFAADYIINMCEKMNGGSNISSADMDRGLAMLESVGVDTLLASTDPDRIRALARIMGSDEGRNKLGDLGPRGEELLAQFKDRMPGYMLNAVMSNPVSGFPALSSLWLQAKGYGGLAKLVDNPYVFYSMAALLLFGGFTLIGGLFGDDDAVDEADAASLMRARNRQHDDAMASVYQYQAV